MKKLLFVFIGFVMMTVITSCGGILGDDFNVLMLYGTWQEGTVYEVYEMGGTGVTWDEKDDTSQEDGQPFTWTLDGSTLIQEHTTVFGSIVPRVYTVTELTYGTLAYSDDYGRSHYFTKVF